MVWIAAAIVVSVVLLLIDRNQKWRSFWRLVFGGLALCVITVAAYSYLDNRASQKALAWDHDCAVKVRAAYPNAYDDLDDYTLVLKVSAKRPDLCPPQR